MILKASRVSKRSSENKMSEKTRVHTAESHPIQQSRGMNRPVKFMADPSKTQHCSQIHGDMHPTDQHLGASWNPMTATFIHAELVAPTPPAGTLLDLPL
jgi:hypothetical protein